jgi:alpha-L-arabinofuranosidase
MPSRYGYVPVKQSLIAWARVPSNRVRVKAEEWAHYQELYPMIKEKNIFLSIDEWAYTGAPTDLKLALAYAMVLQEMFRHTGFIKMSAFTMGVSTINFNATEASFNTTGLTFKLYRDHFGTIPVEVSGNSPQPAPKWPVGGEQPATSPGSPTYPLDISAAFTADRKFLTVAVVNATEEPQSLNLNIKGIQPTGQAQVWEMTGASPGAANVLGKAPEVQVTEKAMPPSAERVSIAPVSISIYQFSAKPMAANSELR